MLREEITFTNFDDEEVTEIHYFNINETEIIEMNASYGSGSVEDILQNMLATRDQKGLIDEFKRFILLAYGKRDGNAFLKSPEETKRFEQSLAYNALFLKMIQDLEYAANFIVGILPKQIQKDVGDQIKAQVSAETPATTTLPPPPPHGE